MTPAEQADDDLRWVMSSAQGRRWLWRLLNSTRLFAGVHTGEALTSAHAEGGRAVGVAVMLELQRVDRRAYLAMVQEAIGALPEADGEKVAT